MGSPSEIVAVRARQVFSERGHPGVEAQVTTRSGATGVAVVTAGLSVGPHEVRFVYDGGERWRGRGVQAAVNNVVDVLGPALLGMDASRQPEVDAAINSLDDTPDKSKLGGNATASVSAAALKAGAASLGIPLYQHIGGVDACTLPVPGVLVVLGSSRYGGGERAGGKPTYSFICYGFAGFAEASYAAWDLSTEFRRKLAKRFQMGIMAEFGILPPGQIRHDRELWDAMVTTIHERGYDGRVGLQVDVAAGTYYDRDRDGFVGLFSAELKSRDDLLRLYESMVRDYPFVILEDPLHEDDFEGHALLARELGIEIVGDDLFATNLKRVRRGVEAGAANAILLKVNQVGTISEAFDMVRFAYRNGFGIMPCGSRGEGPAIADYAVGLNSGHLREGAVDAVANRLLQIEEELGPRAHFPGRAGLKP